MYKISAVGLFCCDKFEETPKQKVIDLSKFKKIYFSLVLYARSIEMTYLNFQVDKFVTALFFDETKQSNDILSELENIDDEADVFEIRFVRINDAKLAEDFSLKNIPSLVYFRNGIPIVYQVI